MSEQRADWVFGKWFDTAIQFDYFATGMCLAMLGFVATHLPTPLFTGIRGGAALVATLMLVAAIICGVKRAESMVLLIHTTAQRVYLEHMSMTLNEGILANKPVSDTLLGLVISKAQAEHMVDQNRMTIVEIKKDEQEIGDRAALLYRTRSVLAVIALFAILLYQAIPAP